MCVAPSKRAAATPSDALLPNNIPMSHATPPKGQLESHSLCVLWLRFQVHYNAGAVGTILRAPVQLS